MARAKKFASESRNRSQSSRQWLERQLNDPYVARAKREGMRSRAAYKLMEIDDKARFLKKGARVVDLGAAPGGWSQIAVKRVGAPESGRVIAIDVLPMEPGARRRFFAARFPRPRSARATQGNDRRTRQRGAVRHGRQCHRPCSHRSPEDHGARGIGRGICPRSACAGGHLSGESAARRHRSRAASGAQARLSERQTCEAGGKPCGLCASSICWRPGFVVPANAKD